MRKFILFPLTLMLAVTLLTACQNDPSLTVEVTQYGVRFRLPEGWTQNTAMQVMGGYGFSSPDYAGRTYLRLHDGAGFVILGEWETVEDAAALLEDSFARDISEPENIEVMGQTGTYATGTIDQGQSIGAVHVMLEIDGETRQFGFVGVIADEDWGEFEATFREIIETLEREEGE